MFEKKSYEELEKRVRELEETILRHKETEAKLAESECRYRLLAEKSTDVTWTMTLDGQFTYISPSSFALSGFTPEEACNISLKDSVTPESYNLIVENVARELKLPPEERSQAVLEIQQYTKNGSVINVEVAVRLIMIDHGFPVGIHRTTRDISERKHAEKVIEKTEIKFEQLYETSFGSLAETSFVHPLIRNDPMQYLTFNKMPKLN